jgi:hypothetical protein
MAARQGNRVCIQNLASRRKRGSRQQLAADVLEELLIFLRLGDEKGRPRPTFDENWLSQSRSTLQPVLPTL